MTVKVFRAADPNAPILNGQVGTLTTVLYQCLVTGYGITESAGWTMPFFDNLENSVFRPGLPNNGFHLRLNDKITSYSNYAVMAGYLNMTDLNAGSDATPSATVNSLGVGIRKSTISSSLARDWTIIANHRFIYLIINTDGSSNYNKAECFCFGQFDSFKDGDLYNCLISGRNPTDYNNSLESDLFSLSKPTNESISDSHLMRSYTQLGSSVIFGKHFDTSKKLLPFPNTVDGNLFLSPVYIHEPQANSVRGKFPGLWNVCHNKDFFNHGDTFSGNGLLNGKTFMIIKVKNAAFAIEISDTWDL